MVKIILFQFLLLLTITTPVHSQIPEKSSSTQNDTILPHYNPLHLGNKWYYYNSEYNDWAKKEVVSDTVVNELRYYKVNSFLSTIGGFGTIIEYERNDENTGTNYKLDIHDLDKDGRRDDEIMTDSINVPDHTIYLSWRFVMEQPIAQEHTTFVKDKFQAVIFGEVVTLRNLFWVEGFVEATICDKFGVIRFAPELAPYYTLRGCIIDGVHYGNTTGIEDKIAEQKGYQLYSNYPNPFNPETVIRFSIPEREYVKGTVYNSTGERVAVLQDGEMEPGSHSVSFNGKGLSSGVYIFRLEAGGYSRSIKMMLLQ
ncbi:MAG: T9SS type A sorting domain-containing protein [Ignavibacteriaceae bacterium]|nr:T9SS type A sorting domain-containing protein [Ignavibacteriaceae bacterium]NUM71739.1 T9SS type A sorting domain-containing protein [Ignavibacteriaceae bacterium]